MSYENNKEVKQNSIFIRNTDSPKFDILSDGKINHSMDPDELKTILSISKTKSEIKKNSLLNVLCRFFNYRIYGGDRENSIHDMLHDTDYKVVKDLFGSIIKEFNSFKERLEKSNIYLFEKTFEEFEKGPVSKETQEELKNAFEFQFYKLKELNVKRSTPGAGQKFYLEKNIINDIWTSIIHNLKRHSDIDSAVFNFQKVDDKIIISISDQKEIDLDNFITVGSSLNIYKRISNYGTIEIFNKDRFLDIISGKIIKQENDIKGSTIVIKIYTIDKIAEENENE
ncbi:MAG TPA: hypothetical protein PLK90_01950 [Clostridiales bacterium]|nr:hypothetical protein [Clostridiales bacterium]HQP69139.1 hypothetical protein [Clostridiales bacterium]